jgi:2-polyprenyl-6-methoxyphenol hydroxylase-like FAD-dependent oxidoreductase
MHPVTAHGFNLGLSSAHLLATEVTAARDKGLSYYTEQVLKAYQRKHIRQTRIMYYGTNGIVNLFTDDRIPGRFARKAVLGLSRRCPPIRWAIEHKLTDLKPCL